MRPLQPWAHGFDEIRFRTGSLGFDREAMAELLEHIPLAMAVTLGPEHRYVFANRLFRSVVVSWSDTLVGKTVREVWGDGREAELQAVRRKVFETGEPYEAKDIPLVGNRGQEPTYWDIKLLPVRDENDQVSGIVTLATEVTERVKAYAEIERQSREAVIDNKRLSLAVDATELGLWEWDIGTGNLYWSDQQKAVFGLPKDYPATYETWVSALHPEDRDRVLKSVSGLLEPDSGGQLHFDHRIVRPDGSTRWISARGRMLYESEGGAWKPARLLGTVLDITDRRRNEEARQLLVHELNHRVKNLFAMASGMVTLSARTAASPKEMAVAIRGRLDALARAHELIRPAITGDEPAERETMIADIVETVLAPHIDQAASARMVLDGLSVPVGARTATGLTLVLHELATNASKYGALSVQNGLIRIKGQDDGSRLVLLWQEVNGPKIEREPQSEGFGSQLARKSVTDQLGGEISYDWRREGLHIRIRLPYDQLSL